MEDRRFHERELVIKRDQFHLRDHERPPKDPEAGNSGRRRKCIVVAAESVDDQAGDNRADDPRNIAERILNADPAPGARGPANIWARQ